MINIDSFECFEPIDYVKCELPDARCYHTTNFHNQSKSIYMFGGWNGDVLQLKEDSFTALWRLTSTHSGYLWEKIRLVHASDFNISLINKRGHTANITGNEIYLFGGIEGFNRYTNDLLCFNLDVSTNSNYHVEI